MFPLGRLRSLLRSSPRNARSDNRVHVCQVVPRLRPDGIGGRVVETCNGLDPTKVQCSCLSVGPREHLALERLEPRVEVWSLHDAGPASVDELVRRAAAVLRRYGVDIVHTHGVRAHRVGGAAAGRVGVPLVHTVYEEARPGPRPARCIAASTLAADLAVQQLGFARDDVAVVPTGVDTERFRPCHDRATLRRGLGLLPEEVVAGAVGEPDVLPGALARADGVRGMVVGHSGGPERGGLVAFPPTRDMPSMLAAMDILVCGPGGTLPALRLLEAMACAVAVAAVDGPGASTVIRDGETGLLVESAADLGGAVRRLAADPALRQELGRAARAYVESHHRVEAMVEAHAGIYAALARPVASF